MNDKTVALETIANLPENSSMEEIAEELQIMTATPLELAGEEDNAI